MNHINLGVHLTDRFNEAGTVSDRRPLPAAGEGRDAASSQVFAFRITVNSRTLERWDQGRNKPNEQAAPKGPAEEIPIGGRLPISLPGMFPIRHGLARAAR